MHYQRSEHQKGDLHSQDKWRYTLYTTLVLIILFNPGTYVLMNNLLQNVVGTISSKEGCPTTLGFGIHVVVFTLIVRYMMDMHI